MGGGRRIDWERVKALVPAEAEDAGEGVSGREARGPAPVPTPEEADRYARLLQAGVPPVDALRLVRPSVAEEDAAEWAAWWGQHGLVTEALERLQGGAWEQLPEGERIRLALSKHYAELAYVLMVHHYGQAPAAVQARMDIARRALEAYVAGTAGRSDPLADLYQQLLQEKRQEKKAVAAAVLVES